MELAKPLRKTPVLARVCYGFIGNRMMEGYAREAQRLTLEGATPRQVDTVLEHFGMAMGILAVFDMAGIDVGVNVHRANAARYPPDPTYYQADVALHEAGRLGQKTGKGYYRYEKGDRTRHDDPEALAILRATRAASSASRRASTPTQEILERCLYPLLNEGLRILEEGIAHARQRRRRRVVRGLRLPALSRRTDVLRRHASACRRCSTAWRSTAQIFGPMHWEPAPLLVRLVREGRTLADWERTTLSRRTPMKVNDLIAIDVHTHAEVSCRQEPDEASKPYDDAASKYFKAEQAPDDPGDGRLLPRAQDRPRDVHGRHRVRDGRAPHLRTRKSSTRRARTPT